MAGGVFFLSFLLVFSTALCKERFYKTLYLDVPLDHFSYTTNQTFKLRYLLNDTYWDKDNGPVFFYTGNEGAIELFAEHTGLIWEMAPEFNALIVFAEHRYYGKSMPFGNISLTPEKIGYLTSSQAIADYVDLISYLLRGKNERNKNPVFAIGGSYGGMLSAYIRMKYPHIVTGAIAASAPILQFENLVPCDAFYRIVTSVYRSENASCSENIKKSWLTIRNITSTPNGRQWIKNQFQLCNNLKDGETDQFIDWLIDIYTNLAMVNYPYDNDFLAPLPGYPIAAMCQYMRNTSLTGESLLVALSKSISVYTNFTGKKGCNKLDADDSNGLGTSAWDFQVL